MRTATNDAALADLGAVTPGPRADLTTFWTLGLVGGRNAQTFYFDAQPSDAAIQELMTRGGHHSATIEPPAGQRIPDPAPLPEPPTAADVIAWLDGHDQTGYIGQNYRQVIAREAADHFGLPRPRDYIEWYDSHGFGP